MTVVEGRAGSVQTFERRSMRASLMPPQGQYRASYAILLGSVWQITGEIGSKLVAIELDLANLKVEGVGYNVDP